MIKIGTRGSDLALWQANHVAGLIGREKTEIKVIKTKGDTIQNVSFDKMEGKAFFTKEIEDALLNREVDLAVHSMKDLPTDDTKGLRIGAVIKREDPSDLLLIREEAYDSSSIFNIKADAKVGTSSLRRMAQIKNAVNSLDVLPLRGNVPTRVGKLRDGNFDAIIIAKAGIIRLNIDLAELRSVTLPFSFFLPSPSQGALALQIRENDGIAEIVESLNHADTEKAVSAERSFLKHFGGGCHVPIGAFANIEKGIIQLTGSVTSTDGKETLRYEVSGDDPEVLGEKLAAYLKSRGADKLL
ncbi:MAG: hydroxymethylbilane synthase [Spirochaetes bacterium]|nr:hydroxymethylbilane synthase [Spirochaetota bacterium]